MATTEFRKPVIAVAYYSTYGHVAQLAESVIKGVEAAGATVKPYCIKETLSEEILTKMHGGGSLNPKYPVLTPDDLREVDGVIFGAPTRYGRAPAQLSAFFDACGGLWATGALVGKFAGFFTSVAGQHGGHETTALTTLPFFAHQGMCYVPQGFVNPYTSQLDAIAGGSAWGASTVAASDGSRQPQEGEFSLAEAQGKSFAEFVGTYVRGKQRATAAATAGATSTATTSAAEGSTAAPVLGKAIPVANENEKEAGYVVPTQQDPAAPAAAAVPANTTTTASAETPAAAPAATTTATPATAPAAAAAPATTAAPAQPKKKGGLFASCCGGRGIEN